MNLINCVVTEIIGDPYFEYDKWWVNVEYDCYGSLHWMDLIFSTKEEALAVEIGYKFLS